jgi:hypothetical protein
MDGEDDEKYKENQSGRTFTYLRKIHSQKE